MQNNDAAAKVPWLAAISELSPDCYTRDEAAPIAAARAKWWAKQYRHLRDDIRSAATLGLIEATPDPQQPVPLIEIKRSINRNIKETILDLTRQPPDDYDADAVRDENIDPRLARFAAYLARCDEATRRYVKMVYGADADAAVAAKLLGISSNAAAQIRRRIAPFVAAAREFLQRRYTPEKMRGE